MESMAGMLPGVECARRRRFHQGGSLDLQLWGCDRRSRRSSFCLYQSDYTQQPQHYSMTRSALQPARTEHQHQHQQQGGGYKLREAAREARERLDERLRAASLSSNKRRSSFWCRNSSQYTCDSDPHGNKCLEEASPPRGWLASAASVTEARRPAVDSTAQNVLNPTYSTGLSKASIDLLQREAFTCKEKDSGKYNWKRLNARNSQQEECPVCLEPFQSGQVLIHLPCTHGFHSNCLIP
ncbi:hypothetical protein KI387_028879, partial [Taxus chinensis]